MTRTIEIASNAAASSWTSLANVIDWRDTKWGGMAHDLEVGTGSGFNLDDDAGSVTLPVKRVLRAIEDATSPDTTLFKGRVSDKNLARGTRFTGDAKQFDTSLDDSNSQVFGLPVDGWSRGAETDYARVQALAATFLNGSPRASTDLDVTTYVPNTNTVTLPAKQYDATDVGNVLRDCALSAGKQVFVTVDDELFYDLDTSVAYASTLSITDSSPNLTTSFPPGEPTGQEQGNEFFTGGILRYGPTATVTDTRSSAETAHDYWRTVFYDNQAGGSTATQRLATMLDNQSVEEKRYTCILRLLDTEVDKIKYGHTVSFRSAAAGVTTPATLRVASLYWEPIGVGVYLAHLELGVPQKLAGRVRRDTPPAPVDEPFVCIPTDFTVPAVITDGSEIETGMTCFIPTGEIECSTDGGTGDSPPSYGHTVHLYAGATYSVGYGIQYSAGANHLDAFLANGIDTLQALFHAGSTCPSQIGIDPPIDAAPTTGGEWATIGYVRQDYTALRTADHWANLQGQFFSFCDNWPSSVNAQILYLSGPDPRFEGLGPCSNGEPRLGQTVKYTDVVGDGTTTAFTTSIWTYMPGSLRVEVNGLDWTPEVNEDDPSTGAYSLDYPVPLGATSIVTFRRAA